MCGFPDLLHAITQTGKDYDEAKIRRAYEAAEEAHRGQMRRSGESGIAHAAAVAVILVDWGMDADTVAAGLLHDVVEDTAAEPAMIREQFGEDVARMVEGASKLGRIPISVPLKGASESIPNMLLAVARDIRIIAIRLADRLHNMRMADTLYPERQRNMALEVLEVYVPIARRLGLRPVREELEILCIRYLDPIAYKETVSRLEKNNEDQADLLNGIQDKISGRLGGQYPSLHIDCTVMSVYEVYKNMYLHGKEFEEIYNIYTVCIVVDTVHECYEVLGEIHNLFRPIPYRFQDFIATPKANGYQSIHTTVIGGEGVPFEVRIRTWDMHYTAEHSSASNGEQWDEQEITGEIKSDFSSDQVYVLTPKGDVISLPVGATVIDFAYAVHADIGNRMVGARVDGRLVPLDTQVQNVNIVEAITSSRSIGPSPDWLHIVRTESASREIRKRLNLESSREAT